MRKSRIKELSMEVTVGAFMFMVLLALGVFTIILSSENIFRPSYLMDVLFEDVMGLRVGDKVLVRGVEVGKVKGVSLEPDGVHLQLSLQSRVLVKTDYRIDILPSSVLGGKHVQIYEGTLQAKPLNRDLQLRGTTPIDLVDQASRTIESIREALEEGGILENLKTTMAQFKEITSKLNEGEGTLARLMNNSEIYDELKIITKNLGEVSTRLTEGKGTLAKLLSEDDHLYQDLSSAVKSIREMAQSIQDGKGTLGKLLSEDDQIYNDLAAAAKSIRELTHSINEGEGTLGKLAKDDTLYEDVKVLVREIRATVDDFRETAPITTFTSVFFGAF